jgi:FixJ family two-component response regulator
LLDLGLRPVGDFRHNRRALEKEVLHGPSVMISKANHREFEKESNMSLACTFVTEVALPVMPGVSPVVFVVDDDLSVRESLDLLIRCEGWQAETFASAQEFLGRPRAVVPSCLVLDASLPGLSGLELQKRVAAERTDMPVIFITGYADVAMSVQAMKAGAVDFLIKPFRDDVLLKAIRQAIERSRAALDREAAVRTIRNAYASLSCRERQVMELVVAGLLNKQIGGELGISEITVKAHRGRVMQKMHADSLPDLVRMAARLGLASAPKRVQSPIAMLGRPPVTQHSQVRRENFLHS